MWTTRPANGVVEDRPAANRGGEGDDKPAADRDCVLCVDLDGTLVRTDLLLESLFALLRKHVLSLFRFPYWLYRGKAYFKSRIAEHVAIEPSSLPYNETLLHLLKEQRAAGRSLVLVTASPLSWARRIAEHLGIFDAVMATTDDTNLSGTRKLAALTRYCGTNRFDYVANGRPDLAVWASAREAIAVNPDLGVRLLLRRRRPDMIVLDDRGGRIGVYARALRLHQWLKNLLVFLPLIAAHELGNLALLAQAFLAFLAFGLCASSTYLLNDLLDLEDDRVHPRKRLRPLASGTVSIRAAALWIPSLLLAALAIASLLPIEFVLILGGYYLTTLAYSLWLKRLVLIDVLTLAMLYTLRVFAGAAATGIQPSFWLLAFSMFLFLSLAMIKRFAELDALRAAGKTTSRGRDYSTGDLAIVTSLGAASGYLSVLVVALYINSENVRTLYDRPEAMWLLCPLLLYWISRIWIVTTRGRMHEDPVVFAVRDPASLAVGGAAALTLWLAI